MRKLKFNLSTNDLVRTLQSADRSVSLYILFQAIKICKAKRASRVFAIKLWRKLKSSAVRCAHITKPSDEKGANK